MRALMAKDIVVCVFISDWPNTKDVIVIKYGGGWR